MTKGSTDGGSVLLKTTHPNTSFLSNITSKQKTCGSKAHPKSPATIRFEWYAKTPTRSDMCRDRQRKSSYKQIVN